MVSTLTYQEAVKQVRKQVEASRTSFRAGMAVLPRERREAMYALYGFCRMVDDIADDSPSPEKASHDLMQWKARITGLFRGIPTDAITTALLPAVARYNLIEKDFRDIIEGMEMDARSIVAPDFATLDLYCDRVASAVGRISIRIFGAPSFAGEKVAHHLGRAFQLTNILRDLAEDAARNRLYLPRELLEKHGIMELSPQDVLKSPHLPDVCRDLAALAKDHFDQADTYMEKCPSETIRPARIMSAYYGAIFSLLLDSGWKNLGKRVSLPAWRKVLLLLKGLYL
ncbi:MAG: presqualene diphosphate synthase HpnD [Alphaproteobacteria bacterium]|nr:presqualene diphosphate synthase HpnD [Alphaproteobacteria bacterium]